MNAVSSYYDIITRRVRADLTDVLTFVPDNVLRDLQESLSVLSPELIPIHERLVNIRRQLVALAAKETAAQAAMSEATRAAVASGRETESPMPCPDLDTADGDAERESKTPTKDQPNPEPVVAPKLRAELRPIQEELRKIDSLSVSLTSVREAC